MIGHKAAQGDGEDAATACWAGHTGVHTAGDGKTYLNRHRKKKNAVVCEWFDSKFPAGNGEREGLQSEATRVKKQAVQNCLRAKKRLTRAAGETG